jgi:hypothetical protein
MKRVFIGLLSGFILSGACQPILAQQPGQAGAAETNARVIGEVVAADRLAGKIMVRTDAGDLVAVSLSERTVCLHVPPGEHSLEKASRIQPAEIEVGDRVLARGEMRDDKKSATARQLVVMRKADIEEKRKREREAWLQRSIAGIVKSLDPNAREIVLRVSGREGQKSVTVSAAEGAEFRRYAIDSSRFSDAGPSSFGELKPGDQLRALGEKSADGTRFTAEALVSGSFVTFGARVTAISAQTGQIEAAVLGTRRPIVVIVGKNSTLRLVPREMAAQVARSWQGQDESGAQANGSTQSFQEVIERLPALSPGDIKPGDVIALSGTAGPDQSRVNVTTLLSGIDSVLSAWPRRQRQVLDVNTGLPTNALNFGSMRP